MDTATVYELIGYVGSGLIVISLMMQSLLRLRIVNLVGAAFFTVYGLLIAAPPVWVVNGAIVLIDLWFLRQMLTSDEDIEILEVDPDDAYLQRLLEAQHDDIRTFMPEFDGVRDDHRAFLVLRDLTPAAAVLVRRGDHGRAVVDLDYALPAYRDFTSGEYVYGRATLLDEFDAREVEAAPGNEEHRRYLRRMGFEERGEVFVRDVG